MTRSSRSFKLGPSPPPTSPAVAVTMKANVAADTGPEIMFRRALRSQGLPGYRLHWAKAPGRPDVAFPGKRVAVFINGCFWHRCPYCDLPLPKSNRNFWERKFALNKERDEEKLRLLRREGWKVFVFWECQIKKDPEKYAKRVKDYIIKHRLEPADTSV